MDNALSIYNWFHIPHSSKGFSKTTNARLSPYANTRGEWQNRLSPFFESDFAIQRIRDANMERQSL